MSFSLPLFYAGRTINMPISTDGSAIPTTILQTTSPVYGLGESLVFIRVCVCVCVCTINMPISTEGSGMPTKRPKTGSLVMGQLFSV